MDKALRFFLKALYLITGALLAGFLFFITGALISSDINAVVNVLPYTILLAISVYLLDRYLNPKSQREKKKLEASMGYRP